MVYDVRLEIRANVEIFIRTVKISPKKFVISKIVHLYLQRDYKINILITQKRQNMKATALNYSTAFINRNYRIKVSGIDNEGNKIHKLVGVSGAINLIGVEMLNKFIGRAINCMDNVCVCKLRRGIKFSFYAK